jgi:mannose-binding lectin 2
MGRANEGEGKARGLRGAPIPTRGKLTYFQENYLQFDLQYKTPDQWVQCFNVANVTLPQVAYLGFSAHCGELSGMRFKSYVSSAQVLTDASDNHDIISVAAKNLYSTSPNRSGSGSKSGHQSTSTKPPKMRESSGGWGWFFMKFIIFVVVCGGGYVGWIAYRAQRRSSRF